MSPIGIVFGAACVIGLSGSQSALAGHVFTIEDGLKLEGIGQVRILPGGTIVYEHLPPYEERASFGFDELRANARLMVVAPHSGSARPLFEPVQGTGYMLAGVSPSGARVAVQVNTSAGTSGAVVSISTGEIVCLDYAPYGDYWDRGVTWLSDSELLYSVAPSDYPSLTSGTRVAVAKAYSTRWAQAFAGHTSTASVLRSRPNFVEPQPTIGTLIRANARTGKGRILAPGLFLNMQLSPSGRYVVALQRTQVPQAMRFDPKIPMDSAFLYQLKVVRVDRDQASISTPCDDCEVLPQSIVWDSQYDRLIFFARARGALWRDGDLYAYDAEHRSAARIEIGNPVHAAPEATLSNPDPIPYRAVALAGVVALPARSRSTGRQGRASETIEWRSFTRYGSRSLTRGLELVSPAIVATSSKSLTVFADGDLWKIDLDGHRKNLTTSLPRLTDGSWNPDALMRIPGGHNEFGIHSAPDDRRAGIAVGYVEGRLSKLAYIDLQSDKVVDLGSLSDDETIADVSRYASEAVVLRSDGDGIRLTRTTAMERLEFARLNSFLADFDWPQSQLITYHIGANELTACVWRAPGASQPLPIIVYIYPEMTFTSSAGSSCGQGGPDWTTRLGVPGYDEPQFLANLGYTVVQPETPAKLLDSPHEALSGYEALVAPAVDAVAARHLGNAQVIGLFGMSQGGFSVLKLLTQSRRYTAAVAMNSNADWASDYAMFGSTRAVLSSQLFAPGRAHWYAMGRRAKSTPWDDPGWFVRSSPYFDAEAIETPLMLVHTDLDTNFPMSQFDEIYTALLMRQKEVDYVRYWGEGHGLYSPANIRDFTARLDEWFRDRLLAAGGLQLPP